MTKIFIRGAIGAVAACTAVAGFAGAAEAKTVRGTVVHHNRRAHSFVVADVSGHLFAVHSARSPRIGQRVVATVRLLQDGTYSLQHQRTIGRNRRSVRVRGVVSWENRRAGEFTVSAPGVSMLVVHRVRRAAASAADALPPVGSTVVATGTVDDQGDLQDQSVQDVGQTTGGIQLEGTVLSIDTTNSTITVSADDEDQSGSSVVVSVPSTLDITQFTVGEEVELLVQPTGAGTATLLGSADDGSSQTANSQGDQQGQNPGEDGQGDNSQGDDQSSGDGGSGGDSSTTGGDSSSTGGDSSTTSGDSSTTSSDSSTTSSGSTPTSGGAA